MTSSGRRVLSDEQIERALARRTPNQAPPGLLAHVVDVIGRTPQPSSVLRARPRVGLRRATALLVAALLVLALALLIAGQQQQTVKPSGGLGYIRDGDVYAARSDGTHAVKLLDDPAVDFTRITSLDGGRLAVEGQGVISIIDLRSGAHHRGGITQGPTTWHPAGHEYAYVTSTAERASVTVIVDVDSGVSRELPGVVPAGERSWSPDGRWLASARDDSSLVVIDAATGAPKANLLLASDMAREVHDVAWSPDSSSVAFVSQLSGVCDLGSVPTSAAGATAAPVECSAGRTSLLVASLDNGTTMPAPRSITEDISDRPSQYLIGPGMLVAWSPDGKWIAYRARSGLSIVRPDGSDGRALVTSPIGWFAWAADSTGLDFVVTGSPDDVAGDLSWIALDDGTSRPLGIAKVDQFAMAGISADSIDGTAPQSPDSEAAPTTVVTTPGPAPDADPTGTWRGLIFPAYQDQCSTVQRVDFGVSAEAFVLTGRAGRALVSPDGSHAAVDPGDRRHFVPGQCDEGALAIIDLQSGVRSPIEADATSLERFTWSPGGHWLGSPGGIVGLDGTLLNALPTSDTWEPPVWSPDDSRVSVTTPDGLLVGDGDGADLRNVGAFPQVSSWSHDGSRFAFLRDGDAWIARADGTEVRPVTGFEFGGAGPMALSPDGETLAVIQAGAILWLMGLDGTRRQVALDPDVSADWARLRWSPDGRRLAVEVGRPDGTGFPVTYLVAADGSTVVRLDDASNPTWSPDGHYLALEAQRDGGGSIDVVNADGSGRIRVTTGAGSVAWVPRS